MQLETFGKARISIRTRFVHTSWRERGHGEAPQLRAEYATALANHGVESVKIDTEGQRWQVRTSKRISG